MIRRSSAPDVADIISLGVFAFWSNTATVARPPACSCPAASSFADEPVTVLRRQEMNQYKSSRVD
jgi:hypothetical protein